LHYFLLLSIPLTEYDCGGGIGFSRFVDTFFLVL
jgi:hypothetical protein